MSDSGKKRKHTLKAQIIVEQKTKLIICTSYGKGKEHDFKIYKKSKINLAKEIELLGDKGYQGIKRIHGNSQIPHKKPRGKKLEKEHKKQNRALAIRRIVVENI